MRIAALGIVALCASFGVAAPGAASVSVESGGRTFHDGSATGERFAAAGEPGRRATSVLGQDERIPIPDTTVFPFSTIAFLELEDEFGDVFGSCTGTFIGPDVLLTAGHCLWDANAETWGAEHVRVVPGKDGDFEPFGFEYASDWWVPDGYAETGDSEWDWGVVKLPNDLLALDTGWLSVAVADTETLESPEFFPAIVGYPGDQMYGTMWGHVREAFEFVDEFRLYYDIDTAAGQSGSAIWSLADGPLLGIVVGIHTQGGGNLNSGSRIDEELLADLLTGCDAMGCLIDVRDVALPGSGPEPSPTQEPTPSPTPAPEPSPDRPYRSYGVAVARD
jgi:V8-like Glu-specific endopeptidase